MIQKLPIKSKPAALLIAAAALSSCTYATPEDEALAEREFAETQQAIVYTSTVGSFDTSKDLMSIQYDMLSDVDDTQATPATKMLIDYYKFDAIIITGTYSLTGNSSILSQGRDTLNATWTGGKCNPAIAGHCGLTKNTNRYMDASIDWDNGGTLLVPVVGKIWADTLKQGSNTGKVWIAEAGMGDFTRDVIVYMKANQATLGIDWTAQNIKSRIINVQHHPDFNIHRTANGVYNVTNPPNGTSTPDKNGYLPNNITVHWPSYWNYGGTIPNGNGFLNTGWLPEFEAKTDADPVYAAAWNAAFTAGRNKVDFSDMIEVMWILGQDDDLRAEATAAGRRNELQFVYKFAGTAGGATCSDGIQNQGETGTDCGGPCTACGGGGTCGPANFQGQCTADSQCGALYAGSNDCRSSAGGVCYCGTTVCGCAGSPPAATCSDGIQNQGETGTDCGGPCAACGGTTLLTASFASSADGFTYADDMFGTSNPSFASGVYGSGKLNVTVGGMSAGGAATSGGWSKAFTTSTSGAVNVSFKYSMTTDDGIDPGEWVETRVMIDSTSYGAGGYVKRIEGGGNQVEVTFTFTSNSLTAGSHTIKLGGYMNAATASTENGSVTIDDVLVTKP